MTDKIEKIRKMIGKALNNSSASEAAQALKSAASVMHKEGLDPKAFLVRKEDAQDGAKLEVLRSEYAALQRSFDDERRRALHLESVLAAARGNPADLREAKELAIKWHRTSQEQDEKLGNLRGWIKKLSVFSIVLGVGGYVTGGAVANHSSSDYVDSLRSQMKAKDKQIGALQNQLQTASVKPGNKRKAESLPKSATSRNGVYTLKADCINGQGNKFSPAWTVNTNTYEVDESTKMLADGYSLSLSDKAIPANGQRFKLTYQSGSVINCTVVDAR